METVDQALEGVDKTSVRENPKEAPGSVKPGISYIPPSAILLESMVMKGGAEKYGKFNWNKDPVKASTYYDAAFRHLASYYAGEELDPESGLPHLAHVRACMAILIDAQLNGKLIDDRPVTASISSLIKTLTKDKP